MSKVNPQHIVNVYMCLSESPAATVCEVARKTNLSEFQVAKAWRELSRAGAGINKIPPSGKTKEFKETRGRKIGITNAECAAVVARECDAVLACILENPGISVRGIAGHTNIARDRIYKARKILQQVEEVYVPPRWGLGRRHRTYVNIPIE